MKRHILSGLIVSSVAVGLVACGRDQSPVEEAAAPPAEESRMLDRAAEAVTDASGRVGEAATAAKDAASEASISAMEQAEVMRGRAEDEAKAMIDQVKSSLAEGKQDMARNLMDMLSAMKGSLSDALRAEIERLGAMFPDA